MTDHSTNNGDIESPYAWLRLATCVVIMTIGSAGMFIVLVAMPAIEAEFEIDRASASIPFSLVMLGWGLGGMMMGRLLDRFGISLPITIGAVAGGTGLILAALSQHFWQFALINGIFIGFLGCSATFAPLIADITHWFNKRRGIAVAICASGNYLAGTLWPQISQRLIASVGWRETYIIIGIACIVTMLPLTLVLRRRIRQDDTSASGTNMMSSLKPISLPLPTMLLCLSFAGVGCCVAMAMPQVHLVSLSHDLGFAPARGAEMLSLMLACGIVSRLSFGWLMDRLGGLRTLLIASSLQCLALFFFLPAQGLMVLYIVSALFGLFQGGIVPCYAMITREYFPAEKAGSIIGIIIFATLVGMALGGWISGAIYDWTGSYTAAFINGIGWNLLNISIVIFLLRRAGYVRVLLPKPAPVLL